MSRSLVDIKAQLLLPASLVHDVLPFASCCSVLDDSGLLARREIPQHRHRATQWWTIAKSGTAKPTELDAPYWRSIGTWTGHPPQASSSGLTRSSSPRRDSGDPSGSLPGPSDQDPDGVSTTSSTASKQPINIERANPHGPPDLVKTGDCAHNAAASRSTAVR